MDGNQRGFSGRPVLFRAQPHEGDSLRSLSPTEGQSGVTDVAARSGQVRKVKVYWRYMCDDGHAWEIFRDEDAAESPEDSVCPDGHPAVTLTKQPPVDEIQIALRPAGRIVDRVTGQVALERRYLLVLSDLEGANERVSKRTYLWRELLSLAEKFHGRTRQSAWELWGKLNP